MPFAFNSPARVVTAIVGDGLTRSSVLDRKDIVGSVLLGDKNVLERLKYPLDGRGM